MSKGPIRRSQLIAPFGVGAMVVVKDGTSVIAAGLDHWYDQDGGTTSSSEIRIDEFKVEEWRLQKALAISHLRLPPDFRRAQQSQSIPNTELTVPFLRFPRWHFCSYCRSLTELGMTIRSSEPCPVCQANGRRNLLLQVPFVAVCDQGHLQDFPWRQWVHRTATPTCNANMKLIATGGTSLAGQRVECGCGVRPRSLSNITVAKSDGSDSDLSAKLDSAGAPFRCEGERPWLGDSQSEACGRPLRGSLRSASNVYYARTYSAIFLPRASHGAPPELIDLLKVPPLSTSIKLFESAGQDVTPDRLRVLQERLLNDYKDEEIRKALTAVRDPDDQESKPRQDITEPDDVAFRRAEFSVLRTRQDQTELLTRIYSIASYGPKLVHKFDDVTLVQRLRETRAFCGFSRILPEDSRTLDQRKNALWRRPPPPNDSWLPASVVYGEGIFLQLNESELQEWEQRPEVQFHTKKLADRYFGIQRRSRRRTVIEPRFVLIHTLAHLLINQLTFECGYGSASLRERLFVSSDRRGPMAGLLIYTAAGDSEGTMGGLVKMGQPGYLEPVLAKATRNASWCSTDPVCMEIGNRMGQGPDLCNGAACHNCCLIPETSCEEFNRLLDRTVVVGTKDQPELGFLASQIE
jgi:Domain of unknown function (DUF1998)